MSKSFKDDARQQVFELFDELVHPDRTPQALSREEYKEFMQELIDDLTMRLQTAEEEDAAEKDK